MLVAGCGVKRLETAPVTGTVRLDGKPLHRGTVIFTPELGRAATGEIQPDGSYRLSTYKSGDGALVGRHRVAVIARDDPPPAKGPMSEEVGPSLIPEFYSDFVRSGLSFEVKSGKKNVYDIELSSSAQPIKP